MEKKTIAGIASIIIMTAGACLRSEGSVVLKIFDPSPGFVHFPTLMIFC